MNFHGIPGLEQHDRGVRAEVIEQDTYGFKRWDPEVKRVWDIGGHIGHAAWWASECFPGADIISFEPDPERARFNSLNAGSFPLWRTVNRGICGFWCEDGDFDWREGLSGAEYFYPDGPIYHNQSGPNRSHRDELINSTKRFKMMSVAEAVEKFGIPDVLKIDCEGFEPGILLEFKVLGLLDRIPLVTGEWHFDLAKQTVKELLGSRSGFELVDQGQWNRFRAEGSR